MIRPAQDHEALNIATAQVVREIVLHLHGLQLPGGVPVLRTELAREWLSRLGAVLGPLTPSNPAASGSETIASEGC